MAGKTYEHQLDAKSRMRIPAKIREQLGEGYVLTVAPGGCLYVLSSEQYENMLKKLKGVSSLKQEQLKTARYIIYNSWVAEEDNQGRIRLPENLKKHARIEKNVIVCHGPVYVEIWSEGVWNDYFKDVNFDCLADALDGGTL